MIYEVRTYNLQPGSVAKFEENFAKALPARQKYSKLGAFWHTEIGPLNQVIHVWPYESMEERNDIRADAAKWRPERPATHVLLDAPCSATGAIRRHPDIPHLKKPGDIARLAGLQDRLLDAAADMLAPGGILVYCVCSLEPEEGPERIAALLAAHPGLRREPVAATLPDGLGELITGDGDLRTLPCHFADSGGLYGFYAARLRRLA